MDGSKMVIVSLNKISFINSIVHNNILRWKYFTTIHQANLERKNPLKKILFEPQPFIV